jgi:hypothetical protein
MSPNRCVGAIHTNLDLQEEIMMKLDCRNIARTLLCTGLLLGVGVLARAQEPTSQEAPPASDNTQDQ